MDGWLNVSSIVEMGWWLWPPSTRVLFFIKLASHTRKMAARKEVSWKLEFWLVWYSVCYSTNPPAVIFAGLLSNIHFSTTVSKGVQVPTKFSSFCRAQSVPNSASEICLVSPQSNLKHGYVHTRFESSNGFLLAILCLPVTMLKTHFTAKLFLKLVCKPSKMWRGYSCIFFFCGN